jgi:CRISPR-associated protein Csb1
MCDISKFDKYLNDDGPAALVIREYLIPVEGANGVLFPPTFAAGDKFFGGYNIDGDLQGTNVCLIDSVGSQANRIEPIFSKVKYVKLIPQIVVKAGDKLVNILEAGHRAGDAIVRCSELQKDLQDGFKAILNKNAEPIAKIAPTSLVFGVWDSRDTQAKLPRLVASTIRAFNVRKLTRSAVYAPPVDYSTLDVFSEEDKTKAEGDTKNPLAKRGFVHVPASSSHGGVIAEGGIRRDATLGLSALRLLNGLTAERTLALRRYILGLALTAFTHSPSGYLRQGCLLVSDPDRAKEREFVEVYPSGERQPAIISHEDAFAYAQIVADAFIVGADRTVNFVQDLATKDVQAKGDDKTAKKTGKKAAKKLDQSPIDPEIT